MVVLLKPLAVNIGDRFRIIGDDDVVFNPGRCPALLNHFVNLCGDAGPEISIALGIE